MNTFAEAKPRIRNQRQMILDALRKAGSKGLTNIELSEICQRWAARLQELYVRGYKVKLENLGDGIYNYILVEEPEVPNPEPPKALEVLVKEIESKFGGRVTTSQLLFLLENNNMNVVRKAGTFTGRAV